MSRGMLELLKKLPTNWHQFLHLKTKNKNQKIKNQLKLCHTKETSLFKQIKINFEKTSSYISEILQHIENLSPKYSHYIILSNFCYMKFLSLIEMQLNIWRSTDTVMDFLFLNLKILKRQFCVLCHNNSQFIFYPVHRHSTQSY